MFGTPGHWAVTALLLCVPHLLWHRASVFNCYLRGSVTLTSGSGDVTTCFSDLCLSRLGFEHRTFRVQSERTYQLRHPGGCHNRCGTKKPSLLNRKNKHEQLNNLYLYFHSHKYVESWFDNTVGMQMFKNVILRLWISLHAIGCKYENSPSKIQVIHVVHGIWIIFQGGGGLVLKHVWFKNPHTNLNSYQS